MSENMDRERKNRKINGAIRLYCLTSNEKDQKGMCAIEEQMLAREHC